MKIIQMSMEMVAHFVSADERILRILCYELFTLAISSNNSFWLLPANRLQANERIKD